MRIQLSEHFSYGKLLRFVFPSVIMMLFTSIYGVVDGLFVSNFVGKTPFAALNLIWPFVMVMGCAGFMIGAGGSALVAKTMGEGDDRLANRYFSLLVWFTVGLGILLAAVGLAVVRPVAILLGAEGDMVGHCVTYGSILFLALPFFMLQGAFQSFFVTAEKPTLGLIITVIAGVTNMLLDLWFVGILRWGLVGAALATAASQAVGTVIPLLYFARKHKHSRLHLCATKWYGQAVLRACTNGSSELMTNVSSSVVSMLYNYQLMRWAGEDGIAAYGVIMYVNFAFISVFLGYAMGSAPIVSYHYGAGNTGELKSMLRKSLALNIGGGVIMAALAVLLSGPISGGFVGYDAALSHLTHRGFVLYAGSFLFAGVNILGSSFFTALNNGPVSAAISFLRTLVFQVSAVLLLPLLLELDGIWLSAVVAEALALAVTVGFLIALRKRYRYA